MNAIGRLKLAVVAMTAIASFNAWAQASDSATTGAMTQGTSKSSARKANRVLGRKVLHALSKGGVDTQFINVLAKNGAITLVGGLTDPSQIDKAGQVAKGVPGVVSVKNNLTVHEEGQ
jgi:hyperosmotically inducible periplasmic protein